MKTYLQKLLSNKDRNVFFLMLTILLFLFYKIIFHINDTTFNFNDNFWYISQFKLLNNLLYSQIDAISLTNPLMSIIGWLFKDILNPIIVLNCFILLNLLLSWYFWYKASYEISKNYYWSIISWVFFWFSSLNIYANRANLTWTWFLSLIIYLFIKYKDSFNLNSLTKLFFATFFWLISWHYYILLIWILYFCLLVWYVKSISIKNFIKSLLVFVIAFILSWIIYIYPIKLWHSSGSTIQEQINNNKLDTTYTDVKELFVPNNANFISASYWKILDKWYWWWFRYSLYYWIISWLLIIYCSYLFLKSRKKNNNIKFIVLLIFLWFILLLWDKLVFYQKSIISNLPFKWLELIPFTEVFRKSSYVFFLLTLWLSFLISIFFKEKKLYIIMAIIGALILENNFSFRRSLFHVKTYNLDIPQYSNVLVLPNSLYSIDRYNVNFWYKNNINIFSYPDATVHFDEEKLQQIKDNCILDNLIFWKRCVYSKVDIENFKDKIDYIIVAKYFTRDFFFEESSFNTEYLNNLFYKWLITPYSSTQDYMVYKVNKSQMSNFINSDNNIYYDIINPRILKFHVKNIWDKDVNIDIKSFWDKILLTNWEKFNCYSSKETFGFNSNESILYKNKNYTLSSWESFIDVNRKFWEIVYTLSEIPIYANLNAFSWLFITSGDNIAIGTYLYTWIKNIPTNTNIYECWNKNNFFSLKNMINWWIISNKYFEYNNKITLNKKFIIDSFPTNSYKINSDWTIDFYWYIIKSKNYSIYWLSYIVGISLLFGTLIYFILSFKNSYKNGNEENTANNSGKISRKHKSNW